MVCVCETYHSCYFGYEHEKYLQFKILPTKSKIYMTINIMVTDFFFTSLKKTFRNMQLLN